MSKFRKLLLASAIATLPALPVLAEDAARADANTTVNVPEGIAPSAADLDAVSTAGAIGLGREAHPEEIAAWDVKVMPDGRGLPEGQGSAIDGEELFSDHCASCHGDFAEGVGRYPVLAGGEGSLADQDPVKTVGSYWPYLSTVWDYVNRSMPYGNAQTLEPNEVYAIVAYILYSNFIVDEDFVLSKDNFMSVEMPNDQGFITDDRDEVELAEFSKEPCMEDCKDTVEITMHASILDVTPGSSDEEEPEGAGID